MEAINQEERAFRAALYEVDGIGPARFTVLLNYFGSGKAVWSAPQSTLGRIGLSEKVVDELFRRRKKIHPEHHLLALAKLGISVLLAEDEEYPKILLEVENHPRVLFVRGRFHPEDSQAIAVVGTRKPTVYGREVTQRFVEGLVAHGLTIVSGLARGIDGIAHRAALESGGRTIAVLGGGVDRVYPPEHVGLAEQISHQGVVLSEFAAGKLPVPGNFPARNRVISGLSLGVLVVEGASKSGTKITASLAVEQNRQVFAVPGPITSRYSQAPADLLKLGAKAVTSVDDIIEELSLEPISGDGEQRRLSSISLDELSTDERRLVEVLEQGHLHIDELVVKVGGETSGISSLLTMLELKGVVKHLGGMVYSLVSGI